MRRATLLCATVAAVLPQVARGQVDTSRVVTRRLAVQRLDTTTVRFRRPVSRMVLETAWATAPPTRDQVGSAVLARPRWTTPVLYQRVAAGEVAPAAQFQIAARKVPPARVQATTARDDSTISRQRATDFRVRAEAVARVSGLPAAQMHPTIAANLISELDSVGVVRFTARMVTAGAEPPAEEEGYPEYVVNLARTVVRLRDPRAVRAIVVGGLGTSREAQRFVASQGTASLAVLDSVFSGSEASAPAVVTTWAYALAGSPSRLSFEDSVHVYVRIVLSAQYHPVSFAHATRIAGLFDLTPELDSIAKRATADSIPAAAGAARAASRVLTGVAGSASGSDWLSRLRLRTGLLCVDATRLGADACRRLLATTLAAARARGNAAGVRQAVGRYRTELDQAVAQQRLSAEMRSRLVLLLDGLVRSS